jgi:uroporphyrinogen III methyltransferase/synthase
VLPLYDTVAEPSSDPLTEADYVTFTSSSTVRFFMESASLPAGARVVSIGPVTSETARALGLEVHVEAEKHDIDGLVDAVLADAAA